MAGKKVSSIQDQFNKFKEIIKKFQVGKILSFNHVMFMHDKEDRLVIMKFDNDLWNVIVEDKEIEISELDPTNEKHKTLIDSTKYIEGGDWLELNAEDLYKGNIFNLKIEGVPYEIPISRDLFPIKFSKSDAKDFSYQIFTQSNVIMLTIKKEFKLEAVPNSTFILCKVYKVL